MRFIDSSVINQLTFWTTLYRENMVFATKWSLLHWRSDRYV